jgi:5-methylthioadenosine/S-adenosylhomocysteine deaminase
MSILIRGATIIAMDKVHGGAPFQGDILIEGDRIKAIGTVASEQPADWVIEGRDRLVIPGLVNGHIHTPEAFFKGRYDNMPLELWMTLAYYLVGTPALTERMIYLRSALCAMDALKSGVTFFSDDILEFPLQTMETLGAVFEAYDDVGIRASISGHVVNRRLPETIVYLKELLPDGLKREIEAQVPPTTNEFIAFSQEAFRRYHNRAGRLRFMMAPSGPQRCTVELMQATDELSRANGTPFHTHILETKVQAVTGREFYGKTLIRYMHDNGLLNRNTTIAHGIWLSDEDIELMGSARCSVVHNTLSNMKLGSGICPVRRLLDAGVNLALGSDGLSTSDTPRMFSVMAAAGLLHKISSPDSYYWLNAEEVLHAATMGGAYSVCLEHEIGSLEPGKKADLVVIDTRTANFTPLNDVRNHLVYCENGSSVETVIVNGEVMVEDGALTRVDEAALHDELRAMMPAIMADHERLEARNRAFIPALAEVWRRCAETDISINRWGSDNKPRWPTNR